MTEIHPSSTQTQPRTGARPAPPPPRKGARPSRRRIVLLVTAGMVLLIGLAVLGGVLLLGPGPRPAASSSPTVAASPTAAPTPSAAPSASRSPSPTPSPTPPAAVLDLSGQAAYQFLSPTGNIVCQMASTNVRCSAQNRSWTPPAPADCTLDHGDLGIDANGRATVVCAGDTIRQPLSGSSIPTLAYGRAVRMGDMMCFSQSNGVSCSSNLTGDSIFLARERYELNSH
ncbi:DUF6636 domain-containing protein [Raineyella sp. LH-20]|uniref:DUF6636 domain-containing protein n=1 Tax=Raineyella sp. LH-20 TaxID=3081204 RepID=UPI002953C548|nr:DUF6636 domain-containing protein [Raineyella sp. LH-20]WOP18705.1 DUF6636 domain-containing protein [Raineyella sp. LH-20]